MTWEDAVVIGMQGGVRGGLRNESGKETQEEKLNDAT